MLINGSGVVFSKNAMVDAQSLVVSSAGIGNIAFMAGWLAFDQAAAFLIADTLRRYREAPSLGMVGALQQAQLGIIDDAGTTRGRVCRPRSATHSTTHSTGRRSR